MTLVMAVWFKKALALMVVMVPVVAVDAKYRPTSDTIPLGLDTAPVMDAVLPVMVYVAPPCVMVFWRVGWLSHA